jgi:7-cyano-7-deazaguanine synthase
VKKAVVLLSGGMDSATAGAIARREGFDVHALSLRYGQRHAVELEAARRVAAALPASRHVVLDIDLRAFGGSALTSDVAVPKDTPLERIGAEGVPVTYVPARNTIFLSFALGWAEVLGARDIFIGANALDYSGYPDCRPEYIAAFERVANLGTRAGLEGDRFRIHTPLIALSKGEIVRKGLELGVDFGLTFTCYDPSPDGEACGRCDACLLRLKGFREAGIEDPGRYVGKSVSG